MTTSPGPLVWLPFDPARLGDPPEGLRYEVVESTDSMPETIADVAFFVPPYQLGTGASEAIGMMSRLEVVQTLTAGVDNVRDVVPEHVTLCNGRGIHDTSTAELALTLTLAALRGLPEFVRAHDRHEFAPQWRPSLADKKVLLVGYGSIGQAIEARLAPFEADVVKLARTARGEVHAIDELADLLPEADVVVLIVPLTEETRGLMDAAMLALMKDGALLVNVARGPVVVEEALLAELRSERLIAAVDVVDTEPLPGESPLWQAPGLLLTPHVGGASSAMWPRAHRLVRDQLHRYSAGEPLHNVMTGAY